MIAVDTSALIAIALREAEADHFVRAMQAADAVLIGIPTLLETRMVLTGKLAVETAPKVLQLLLPENLRLVSFSAEHLAAAGDAFARYRKGLNPISLNFGDCMSYAVAKVARCPLLYKGDDFARTDVDRLA